MKNTIKNSFHNAEDILPIDDAFHGSRKHIAIEWWYFDAIFDNGYSIHIGCRTFSKKNYGIVSPILEVYKDSELIVKARKKYLFPNFKTSKYYPIVRLSNKPIIEFDYGRYNRTGEWAYKVALRLDENEVDLMFIGTTKGWKIQTERECWTVALPKALVNGEITINGKKIKVKGIGYHDHNWNYTLQTFMNYGRAWYWGKIRSNILNIIWVNIVKTSSKFGLLAVVNQEKHNYFAINPKNIFFESSNFIRSHGNKTPTHFLLQIDDIVDDIPIHVNVEMESQNIHYSRKLLFSRYWRYHVKTTGEISLGDYKERINNIQFMEFLRFI